MRRLLPLLLALCLLAVGCGAPGAANTDAVTPTASASYAPTASPAPTEPLPTDTPVPTAVPTPAVPVSENAIVSLVFPAEGETVVLPNGEMAAWLSEPYSLGCGYAHCEGKDKFAPDPVRLSWACEKEIGTFTVRWTSDPSFTEYKEKDTKNLTLKITNLLVGTVYYWQVVAHGATGDSFSPVFSFQTARTPRYLSITGIRNTRDIGGYETALGTVKQNMVFRSAQPDTLTAKQAQAMQAEFHIRTDLDLRRPDESEWTAKGCSPLGEDVNFVNISAPLYSNAFNKLEMLRELDVFAHEENYPVLVHCAGGKDRTGTLIFVLEALLGVPEEQLCFDWEATYFSKNAEQDGSCLPMFDQFLKNFKALPGATMQEKAEAFCHNVGFSDEAIARVRSIMLEK